MLASSCRSRSAICVLELLGLLLQRVDLATGAGRREGDRSQPQARRQAAADQAQHQHAPQGLGRSWAAPNAAARTRPWRVLVSLDCRPSCIRYLPSWGLSAGRSKHLRRAWSFSCTRRSRRGAILAQPGRRDDSTEVVGGRPTSARARRRRQSVAAHPGVGACAILPVHSARGGAVR